MEQVGCPAKLGLKKHAGFPEPQHEKRLDTLPSSMKVGSEVPAG